MIGHDEFSDAYFLSQIFKFPTSFCKINLQIREYKYKDTFVDFIHPPPPQKYKVFSTNKWYFNIIILRTSIENKRWIIIKSLRHVYDTFIIFQNIIIFFLSSGGTCLAHSSILYPFFVLETHLDKLQDLPLNDINQNFHKLCTIICWLWGGGWGGG